VSERYAYILMDNEKWWNQLCNQNRAGKKLHAFVRKSIVGPKNAKMLLFYVTHPVKEFGVTASLLNELLEMLKNSGTLIEAKVA